MIVTIILWILACSRSAIALQSFYTNGGTAEIRKSIFTSDAILGSFTEDATTFVPILDFANPTAVNKIERLDDAIMGGISTSSVRSPDDQPYAVWSGFCRTDGGGFCGFRTYGFETPLMVGDADGFYVICYLASDDDAERRVWKMTTRIRPDRGELLYQAPFPLKKPTGDDDWCTVKVPFQSFVYVRGPQIILNGPPLNITGGIYQIGMTMSKFVFGANLKELENFRDGFFELRIKQIGLYGDADVVNKTAIVEPKVLTKEESRNKRPLILKALLPLTRLVFSEARNRRKFAVKILTQKRGMTKIGAIQFCLKSRAKSVGWPRSVTRAVQILCAEIFRFTLLALLRLIVLYPTKIIATAIRFVKGTSKTDAKPKTS